MSWNDWIGQIFSPAVPPPAVTDPPVSYNKEPGVAYDADHEFELLMAQREGRRNDAYRDSLGKLTVGIGHLVRPEDRLAFGDVITDTQVDRFWAADSAAAMAAAKTQMIEAGITAVTFLPYLADVCFQMGTNWAHAKFPNTWKQICAGDYAGAAKAIQGSLWAQQTPVRTADFIAALKRLPPKA